jgi:hypothetical protein
MIIAAALAFFAQVAVLYFVGTDGYYLWHPVTEHSQIALPFIKLSGVILSSSIVFYLCIDTLRFIIFQYITLEYLDATKYRSEFVFHFGNSNWKHRLPQVVYVFACFEMIINSNGSLLGMQSGSTSKHYNVIFPLNGTDMRIAHFQNEPLKGLSRTHVVNSPDFLSLAELKEPSWTVASVP